MEKVQETGVVKKLMTLALAVALMIPALVAPSANAVGDTGPRFTYEGEGTDDDYGSNNNDGEDYGAIPGIGGGFNFDVFGASDPLGILHDTSHYNGNLPGTYGQGAGPTVDNAEIESIRQTLEARLERLVRQKENIEALCYSDFAELVIMADDEELDNIRIAFWDTASLHNKDLAQCLDQNGYNEVLEKIEETQAMLASL